MKMLLLRDINVAQHSGAVGEVHPRVI